MCLGTYHNTMCVDTESWNSIQEQLSAFLHITMINFNPHTFVNIIVVVVILQMMLWPTTKRYCLVRVMWRILSQATKLYFPGDPRGNARTRHFFNRFLVLLRQSHFGQWLGRVCTGQAKIRAQLRTVWKHVQRVRKKFKQANKYFFLCWLNY